METQDSITKWATHALDRPVSLFHSLARANLEMAKLLILLAESPARAGELTPEACEAIKLQAANVAIALCHTAWQCAAKLDFITFYSKMCLDKPAPDPYIFAVAANENLTNAVTYTSGGLIYHDQALADQIEFCAAHLAHLCSHLDAMVDKRYPEHYHDSLAIAVDARMAQLRSSPSQSPSPDSSTSSS